MARTPDSMSVLLDQDSYFKTAFRKGLWRAEVLSLADSEKRGRIQVRILQLHPPSSIVGTGQSNSLTGQTQPRIGVPDALCPWAEPAFPFGGSVNNGFLMLPKVGSTVWVAFEQGFTGKPVWLGGWYGGNEVPTEFAAAPAYVRMLRTPGLHHLIFRDAGPSSIPGWIELRSTRGHFLKFADDSAAPKVTIQSAAGHQVVLDDTSGARKVDVKSVAGHEVLIDDTVGSITAKLASGTQKVEILPTTVKLTSGAVTLLLDSASGLVTVTCTGMTVNASGGGTAVNVSGGKVRLGDGGSFDGVVLGAAMKALFDAHVHPDPGGGNTGAPTTSMTAGTHYSQNVEAKP